MIETWLDRYYEKFDENYPLMITSMLSDDEIIGDIQMCLENGTPTKPVELDEDLDY
jgi:hypothetical protein